MKVFISPFLKSFKLFTKKTRTIPKTILMAAKINILPQSLNGFLQMIGMNESNIHPIPHPNKIITPIR